MFYRFVYAGLIVSTLVACSQNTPVSEAKGQTDQPVAQTKQPVAQKQAKQTIVKEVKPPMPTQSFAEWRAEFKTYALSKNILATTFDKAFEGIKVDESVVKSDYSQPEFSKPVWEYLKGATSELQINIGKKKIIEHRKTLTAIEQQFNVEYQAAVAIWGMESGYGKFTGNKSVIRSLATLAYEGRRVKFAKEQLIAALTIIQQGDISAKKMLGSWAGAMGQTQFMPTSYLQYAVDFDKDGKRNIWTNEGDALASTANYLASHGWQYGETWGHQVKLPKGFDYSQTDISSKKTVAMWAALGVTLVDGKSLPITEHQLQAAIILPAGAKGQAFIIYRNFFSIMRYNNSTSYALAVSLLMDGFKGKEGIVGDWPVDELPLSRTERIELQTLLNEHGYNAGNPDGVVGANTRQAIRDYQQTLGVAADGYPTHELIKRLRETT